MPARRGREEGEEGRGGEEGKGGWEGGRERDIYREGGEREGEREREKRYRGKERERERRETAVEATVREVGRERDHVDNLEIVRAPLRGARVQVADFVLAGVLAVRLEA